MIYIVNPYGRIKTYNMTLAELQAKEEQERNIITFEDVVYECNEENCQEYCDVENCPKATLLYCNWSVKLKYSNN